MYGQNTRMLRESLRELLTQQRIQHRIGARPASPGTRATTVEEGEQIAALITRYRHSVLTWCHQALCAANPPSDFTGRSERTRGPADELRHRLAVSLAGTNTRLPTMQEITTEHPLPTVELWRNAARACALGEHDFPASVGHGRLSKAESLALVHDAAEVTRALIALDQRYIRTPGWTRIAHGGHLARAAQDCAAHTRYRDRDYSIDDRGWTPPAQLIDGPGLPGITGVLQAQHNLRLHLNTIPDAHSLRLVIESQRIVSLHAARHLAASNPEGAARWEHRGQVYASLARHTRDIAGMVGNGRPAAGQGSLAASRAQQLPEDALADAVQARRLERISAGIDHRVGTAIYYGIKANLYLQRANVLGLDERDGTLVHVIRKRCIPITGQTRGELFSLARHELSRAPTRRRSPDTITQDRLDFRMTIDGLQPGATLAM